MDDGALIRGKAAGLVSSLAPSLIDPRTACGLSGSAGPRRQRRLEASLSSLDGFDAPVEVVADADFGARDDQ